MIKTSRLSREIRRTFTSAVKERKILGRYQTVPVDLYRSLRSPPLLVKLRPRKNKPIYDVILHEKNMVLPAPLDNVFIGANGASLRPNTVNLHDMLGSRHPHTRVGLLPRGYVLPEELVLLHEIHDHYSLQTAVPCTLSELNKRLSALFAGLQSMTVEEFFRKHSTPDV